MTRKWHSLDIRDIEKELNTNAVSGLSGKARRTAVLKKQGKQGIFIRTDGKFLPLIFRSYFDPFLISLSVLGIFAALFGRILLGVSVFVISFAGAIATGISYYKATKICERTKSFAGPSIKVIRDGSLFTVDSNLIMQGDVILFSEGDIIPCDARLIESDNLRVTQYRKEGGRIVSYETKKNNNTVYSEMTDVNPPDYENTVYAGSAVLSGSGRAICFSVGNNTYLGALTGGISPSAKEKVNKNINSLKSYYRAYNIILTGLFIPFCIIGVFFTDSLESIDVFTVALALVCTASGNGIFIAGKIISAVQSLEMLTDSENGRIIFGNSLINERICSSDNLFLIGRAGISDGKYKILSIHTCGKDYAPDGDVGANLFNFTGFIYMFNIMKTYIPINIPTDDIYLRNFASCIKEFALKVGTDEEEYGLKVASAQYIKCPGDTAEGASIALADGTEFKIFMSTSDDLISACDYIRTEVGVSELCTETRNKLLAYYNQALKNGLRILSYSTITVGQSVFEGFITLCETADKSVGYNVQEIDAMGTKVSIFLYGKSAEDIALLRESGIFDYCVSDGKQPLRSVFGKHRAYLGYTRKEIESLVGNLRESGHTVAGVGIENADYRLLSGCDSLISFENTESISDGKKAVKGDMFDGYESSSRCSQIMRINSDVLVSRTNGENGGIASVKNVFIAVRRGYRNFADTIFTLTVSQFARFFLVLIPFLMGRSYFINSPELLISGLFFDLFTVFVFAYSKPSFSKMFPGKGIPIAVSHPISSSVIGWVSAGVSSAAAVFLAEIADTNRGIAHGDFRNIFIFSSLILIQLAGVFCSIYEQTDRRDRSIKTFPGLLYMIMLLLGVAAIGLSFFVTYKLNGIGFSVLNILLLPAVPCVYVLAKVIFVIFKRKKHKFRI